MATLTDNISTTPHSMRSGSGPTRSARRSTSTPAIQWRRPTVLSGYKVLMRPMWGWGFETGSHALRLIIGGHFDRFPRARLMLGHLGETLPFLLWRFDSRAKFHGVKTEKGAVRIHQGKSHRDDIGHVLGRAAQLHDRGARQGARHVRRRSSVRGCAGSRRVVRSCPARRNTAGRISPRAMPCVI